MRRQIDVTPEVFHLIWSSWRQGDTDEDSILRRTLMLPENRSLPIACQKEEENLYEKEDSLVEDGPPVGVVAEIGKIRWVDDVRGALSALGGEADLSAIYREVDKIRRAAGRSIVRSLEATVRQTIEAHSSDSDNFKHGNTNYFRHVGRGRWAIR